MLRLTLLILFALSVLPGCGAAYSPNASLAYPETSGVRGGSDAGPRSLAGQSTDSSKRLIARTARLTLEVDDEDDFESTLKSIEALASEFKGYVLNRSSEAITFKVPAARMEEAITRVDKLGEITERWVGAQDVTEAHTDLTVRIENQHRLQARLRELVGQSEDVKTVLEVEKELARVTTTLERLEAQLRGINGRVALATITVDLEEEVTPGLLGWIGYGLWVGVKWLFVWD